MTAPDRIWAYHDRSSNAYGGWDTAGPGVHNDRTEYIRHDASPEVVATMPGAQAMVAAAYEAAADLMGVYVSAEAEAAILALAPADALAEVQRLREERDAALVQLDRHLSIFADHAAVVWGIIRAAGDLPGLADGPYKDGFIGGMEEVAARGDIQAADGHHHLQDLCEQIVALVTGEATLVMAPADEVASKMAERDAALARVGDAEAKRAKTVAQRRKQDRRIRMQREEIRWLNVICKGVHMAATNMAGWNRIRAEKAEAERDAALARVEKLRHQITEASDPDFIFGALDNVHDAETTLDDYAAAVSRAIRAALDEDARNG